MTTPRIVRRAIKAGRRRAEAEQDRRRRSGAWPPWVPLPIAPGEAGDGPWLGKIHTAWKNDVYAVLIRTLDTAWGRIDHASIHTLTGGDISWRHKQRIKDEIFGPECCAVEVYPPQSELIDAADVYHLWILPDGFQFPFTLADRR